MPGLSMTRRVPKREHAAKHQRGQRPIDGYPTRSRRKPSSSLPKKMLPGLSLATDLNFFSSAKLGVNLIK
jgi:hypothetical protein